MWQNNEIEQLVINYLTGEASTNDILLISDWLREDQENEKIFMQIKEYWSADVSSVCDVDYNKVYDDLSLKIKDTEPGHSPGKISLRYAAVAVAAVFIGMFIYLGFLREAQVIHNYSYISGNAVSQISLPDGTGILLNKNSTLTYNNSFGENDRYVSLEGEAFFEVTKDTGKPFIVDLNGTKIKVLGTTFNVRNRPEETFTSAVLLEGSIRFESPNQNILLNPNQELVYTKANSKINVNNADMETVIAWRENLIRYKSLSFSEVTKILEKHYNISIEINSEQLRNEKMTGAFDANLNIEQILDIMKNNIQFKWKKTNDNDYVISK
ncbi:FecR family protein [Dysgonomonas termitidis]|uniref:FecR family protein n=1 Tax=Dysgonomonas termitidis TaxID=1516126 RepID=A0ABV9KSG6_9BACT